MIYSDFKEYLLDFQKNVDNFTTNKEKILESRVLERLEKSFISYSNQLEKACGYLINRKPSYQLWRLKIKG